MGKIILEYILSKFVEFECFNIIKVVISDDDGYFVDLLYIDVWIECVSGGKECVDLVLNVLLLFVDNLFDWVFVYDVVRLLVCLVDI